MENFDFSEIIQICLENHFYNALIYLCTESDNNFMIPLIQIFSYYLFRKGKPDQDLGEIQKIGYR